MKQTFTLLHPAIEDETAAPAVPRMAPRLATLSAKRLALFDNGKVNAGAILTAVAALLKARHGVADVKAFKKRHAGDSGAAVIPLLMAWKPDLVLTALGD